MAEQKWRNKNCEQKVRNKNLGGDPKGPKVLKGQQKQKCGTKSVQQKFGGDPEGS